MKPRTTNERDVARLAEKLPPLTDAQQRWIRRNAIPAVAYHYKLVQPCAAEPEYLAWCSNCGKEFENGQAARRCPHCGAKFAKHEISERKRVNRDKHYTTIVTTIGGWQVSRHFVVYHWSRKGVGCDHHALEAVQIWTNERGEQVINARNRQPLSWYNDAWCFGQPMSIKRKDWYCYDIFSNAIRVCRVLPIVKRNGFNGEFHDVAPDHFFKAILRDNLAETLLKVGQYQLFGLLASGNNQPVNRAAVKIVLRHGYIVHDATMWRDYIDMAAKCGFDIHNPHYACPENLQEAHDRMVELKMRLDAKEKITRAEPLYRAAKGKFLGILIKGRGVTLQPLQSVREFFNEGMTMHHCVFANGYYHKEDSLILSAKGKDGERIETVEFDLKQGRVVQSRGRFNKLTKKHDYIVQLCNENAKRILSAQPVG